MGVRRIGIAVALVAALWAPLVLAAPSAEEAEAAAEAERRGLAMKAHDEAAARAAERFRQDAAEAGGMEALREKGLRGYVVEPFLDAFETVFYGEKDGRRFAVARYTYSGGKIVGGGLLGEDEPADLSPTATKMVSALARVGEVMAGPGHPLCSKNPPNSIVLRQDDGSLSVYVLTSTTDPKVYPAGGHYRFDFDAEGNLVAERRFMTGCFPIDLSKVAEGTRPTLLMTHLLDAQPTEIHSFVSQNVPLSLAVVTAPNRYMWMVREGRIAFAQDKPPPGIPESAFEAPPEDEVKTEPAVSRQDEAEPEIDEADLALDSKAEAADAESEEKAPVDPLKVDVSKLPPPEELPPGR